MIIYNFKSKTKKSGSFVQTVNLTKSVLSLFIFKKLTTVFNLKMVQQSMSQYQKKGTLRIYQFLAVIIATVVLSSCQKESLNNPVLNNTTSDDLEASAASNTIPDGFIKMTWNIEGVTREALVHPPKGGSGSAPIIFAFHGHSGTDVGFSAKGFEKSWPEAIVVYPQGLPTESHGDPQVRAPDGNIQLEKSILKLV